jgi:hypothetical protein
MIIFYFKLRFSKGCVVLNQLCHELIYLKKLFCSNKINDQDNLKLFFNQVKNVFWLDGGHNGGSNGIV